MIILRTLKSSVNARLSRQEAGRVTDLSMGNHGPFLVSARLQTRATEDAKIIYETSIHGPATTINELTA